jgi:predicted RNA binding protein YcfA (HicA-like mRNA interferase family)
MGVKKNIKKLISLPTEMSIAEIKSILAYFGYNLINVKGSHFQFKNDTSTKITIPVHDGFVKKVYLKIIKRNIMPLLCAEQSVTKDKT